MNFINQAKARADTAMAGKKLLDDGGPPMEHYIGTKANCQSAVEADTLALAHMQDVITQYKAAVAGIEKALGEADMAAAMTDDQKAELGQLCDAYKARIEAYTAAALPEPPAIPVISPPEADAVKLLYVKGKVNDAKTRSQEVANKVMEEINKKKEANAAAAA